MPEIQLRSASALDIAALVMLDHGYSTDYVWQVNVQQPEEDEIDVNFRKVRLPRSMRVEYPHAASQLQDDWKSRHGLLLAELPEQRLEIIGYISLVKDRLPATAWITDLVVTDRLRRRGVGTALMLAAQDWARAQGCYRLIFEMQPKNYPAINLAQKLGFAFCGYQDRYFANQDIGLFFTKAVR
ncbi:MAG: GNAT family N-acetyltransferase [Chloroflexota bacterium]